MQRYSFSFVVYYRLLVFAITMYPIISDRILRTRDYFCHFVPAENPQFVIALSFLGHHIPCIVIIVCYIIVFIEIRKLFKTRPGDKSAAASKAKSKVKNNTVSAAPTTVVAASSIATADLTPGTSTDPATGHGVENADNDKSNNTQPAAAVSDNNKNMDQKKEQKNEQAQQAEKQQQQQKRQAAGAHATSDAKARADRERKSFVTLSYIVIGYVICWVPFHFVYDVSFIRPELVSEELFTATFWLTYVNSGINPFLYAFSSADLRKAVVKILKCRTSN